jgi:hypothetical protein
MKKLMSAGPARTVAAAVPGQCLCGDVHVEIDFPARWAWHDHSAASRHVHGAAYATYVGSWRRRFRITRGQANVTQFADAAAGATRSFCARCGTPICYERTGRQARYHIAIEQMPEWTYLGERLVPLKGFPGVFWDRSKRKPRAPPISGGSQN